MRNSKLNSLMLKIALTVDEVELLRDILSVYTESGRGSPADVLRADSIVEKLHAVFPRMDEVER